MRLIGQIAKVITTLLLIFIILSSDFLSESSSVARAQGVSTETPFAGVLSAPTQEELETSVEQSVVNATLKGAQALYGPTCSSDAYGYNQDSSFFSDVLNLMGIPVSQFALNAFALWKPYENTTACWNPLATTYHVEWFPPGTGCAETIFNDHGVRNYSSKYCGELATAGTLLYSGNGAYYRPIRDMLSETSFDWQAIYGALNYWCNGCYSTTLTNQWQNLWNSRGGSCPAPSLSNPPDGYVSPSQTISFSWSAISGCGSGYTFRIKDTLNMDSGGIVVDGIDHGVGGTSTSETISSQWNNRDLYWGVKAANAPNGANWSIRRFRIQPDAQTGNWIANYYDTTDRWFDPNNSSNFKCGENINELTLDKNYSSGAPCGGMDGETWVGDYSRTINFSSANYVFRVEHDDGLKLWLNNQNIADRSNSGTDWICPPRSLSGNNNLRVMLREDGGDAKVKVGWTTDISVCTPNPALLTLNLGNSLRNRSVIIELRYPLLYQLFPPPFRWFTTTDANGNITNFPLTGASPGTTYYLLVKPQGWLRKQRLITLLSGSNSVDMRSSFDVYSAGDIDGNNIVDLFDFQVLSNEFGTASSRSDLNGDEWVDLFDFQLLSNGFGKVGDGSDVISGASAAPVTTNVPAGQLTLVPPTNMPPSAIAGGWTTTGSMVSPRWYQTATMLLNGKVLVAGGYNNGALASAEVYDPSAGIWTATGSMTTTRQIHTATLLPNGKVLVVGGIDQFWNNVASAELYNPATGNWTVASPISTALFGHTATLLSNGKVLVVGGSGPGGAALANAELYDPSTNRWTVTGSMNVPRVFHTATRLSNGRVLVMGGMGSNAQSLASAEVYNPATGKWTTTGSLNTDRYSHTNTLLSNGKVLIAGGWNDSHAFLSSAEVYNPVLGTWTATGSLAIGRENHAATLLPSGHVLASGGWNSNLEGYLSDAELYDPGTGTWAATSSLATARSDHPTVLLPNGKVLAVGGNSAIGILANAELYTSVSKTSSDFDGDGDTDVAVFRPSNGVWYVKDQFGVQYGAPGDIPVAEDYNGNGLSDVAVFRPSNGVWYVKDQFGVQYGAPGDIPVPCDYDGNGNANVAVFRPSNGMWYVKDLLGVQFGTNGDIPVPGDYNGDGACDVAVFRPSNGVWYIKNQFGVQFGANGDIPVPGDYDGDGDTDLAVFRPSNGVWYVKDQFGVQFGANGDIPAPGDFNGDGRTDVAVFRPSNGIWYVKNQFGVQWGANGDIPTPSRP